MKRAALALFGGLVLLGLLPGLATAAVMEDQSNGPGDPYTGGAPLAQTYTSGLTGSLVSVNLYLASNGTETDTVALEHVDGSSLPTGAALATASASVIGTGLDNPAWHVFTFGSPANVTAGTKYALVMTPTITQWHGTVGDAYAGGAAWGFVGGNWLGFGSGLGDFSFVTFVDAAASSPAPSVSTGPVATPTSCATIEIPAAFTTPAPCPSPFQSFQGQTSDPTPPPTSTAADAGSNPTPLLPILAGFGVSLLGLAAVARQRRSVRS
jgi:hypothetical protein